MKKTEQTTQLVQSGNATDALPEFGRCNDVKRLFGLKRGTLYNLLKQGKIRGCLLRVKGNKSGVRLFSIVSVRSFILSQMESAQP